MSNERTCPMLAGSHRPTQGGLTLGAASVSDGSPPARVPTSRPLLAAVVLCAACAGCGEQTREPPEPNPQPPDEREPAGTFTDIGSFAAVGGLMNAVVGPGPGGTEHYWIYYGYAANGGDLIASDPFTGEDSVYPLPEQFEADWGLVNGPDGAMYMTAGNSETGSSQLLRIDPSVGVVEDLGPPPGPAEYMLLPLVVGSDGKIYAGTSDYQRLVVFDPTTLSWLDPDPDYAPLVPGDFTGNGYAIQVAADATEPWIYAVVGLTGPFYLVAYSTAEQQPVAELLPETYRNGHDLTLYTAEDGEVYLGVYAGEPVACLKLAGTSVTDIPSCPEERAVHRLIDGSYVNLSTSRAAPWGPVERHVVVSTDRYGQDEIGRDPLAYAGKAMELFRVGAGPESGAFYASTGIPLDIIRYSDRGERHEIIDERDGGHVYSFLPLGERQLLMGSYGAAAPLMVWNIDGGYEPGAEPDSNPFMIASPAEVNTTWRTYAMTECADRVFIGSDGGYGEFGFMSIYDPVTRAHSGPFTVAEERSVFALACAGGLVVGGTSIWAGSGRSNGAGDAQLFVWDPVADQLVDRFVPVPGAAHIVDLATDPASGLVYGVGITGDDVTAGPSEVFRLRPEQGQGTLETLGALPCTMSANLYGSMASGPDGRLYGLCTDGVFSIDPATGAIDVAPYQGITAGFALVDHDLYFVAGPRQVRYALP